MKAEQPVRILVVEDDESAAAVMALALRKRWSADVMIAHDCASARELFREGSFDLITVDYSLPDGDGLELLEEIIGAENAPPVIIVTGRGDEETAARCLQAGAAGYVIKDQSLSTNLLPAIDRALELARAEAALRESEIRYRRLFEKATDGIILLDADTEIIADVNPSLLTMLGQSRDDLVGRKLWEAGIIDRGSARTALDEARKRRHVREALPIIKSDGTEMRADFTCEAYYEGHRRVIQCGLHDVTTHWHLAAELSSSEHKYRTLFQSMIEGVAICRMIYGDDGEPYDWVYLDVNDALIKMTGLKDPVNRMVSDLIPGIRETNPELFEIYGRVARSGEPENFETRVEALGVDFAVKVVSPALDHFVAVVEDVTDRRAGERALRASEAKYRFLTEKMNDIIWTTDLELNSMYVSPSVATVLGYGVDEWQGMSLKDQLTPESLESARSRLMDELIHDSERDPERTDVMELYYYSASGDARCLETSLSFIRGEDGRPSGIYGLSRDITERKTMLQALETSEERFRQIAEVSNDAIVVMDCLGRATYWNPGAERIFGYLSNEVLGRDVATLICQPQDRVEHDADVAEFPETWCGPMLGRSYEFTAVRKSGESVPVEVSSSAFMADGEPHAVVNIRDITERVKAEAMARRHAEELRDLVDVAAHELRHPATIFKGYASILMRYGDDLDTDIVREAIDAIDRGADRLSMLINKLLDTSRIEHGGMELDLREVDPWELTNSAIRQISSETEGTRFILEPRRGTWTALIDSDRIADVILIILDNAVKHTPAGTVVEITCEKRDGMTVFLVADSEPGIPEHARELIFERFYQVEDASHHSKPGLGLGLYIARTYVEAHGGWIKVEPRPGGGSVFCFAVPNEPTR